jgi:hypothetical protein
MTAIRVHQRTPITDSWGPGTLTPPDPPREEDGDFVICEECPAEIDLVADAGKYAAYTTWTGRQAYLCEHCKEMVGLL